jgi:ATP-dependent Clp protease ATP-binding subunit ClpA
MQGYGEAESVDAQTRSKQLTQLRAVKHELARVTARRSALWHEQSDAPDSKTTLEVARLSQRIETLWAEERRLAAEIRSGPRKEIIARARAADRVERDLGRRMRPEPATASSG